MQAQYSLIIPVKGTEITAPGIPHTPPQKTKLTRTVTGLISKDLPNNLGSMILPMIKWKAAGAIIAIKNLEIVTPGVKRIIGIGKQTAMKGPTLGITKYIRNDKWKTIEEESNNPPEDIEFYLNKIKN